MLHCLQGDKFLDSLDDIAVDGVVLLDGMHIWGPSKASGLTALKLWVADWLHYSILIDAKHHHTAPKQPRNL
jgi:hypothetical protein